jgi:hypothetical protein
MISDLFTTLFGVFTNGIALGTYSSLPATPVWAIATGTESSRTFLDRVCRFLGWKYRVQRQRDVRHLRRRLAVPDHARPSLCSPTTSASRSAT